MNIIRPEYQRKKKLLNAILKEIENEDMVMRAALLKRSFSNATEKEVACCYRALVAGGKVVEIKLAIAGLQCCQTRKRKSSAGRIPQSRKRDKAPRFVMHRRPTPLVLAMHVGIISQGR